MRGTLIKCITVVVLASLLQACAIHHHHHKSGKTKRKLVIGQTHSVAEVNLALITQANV